MLLNGVTGEGKTYEDDGLDFTDTRSVVVLNELYAFKYGDHVSAYKIADFTRTDHLVTTLSTLRCDDDKLKLFAVSYWAAAGSVVLTGGLDSNIDSDFDGEATARTFLLAVQTG